MKRKLLIGLVAALAFSASSLVMADSAPAQYVPIDITKWAGNNANKRIALEYLEMVNMGKRSDAVKKYASPDFINHRSPMSPAQQREANEKAKAAGTQSVPTTTSTAGAILVAKIGRVIGDGDYVAVHYIVTNNEDLGRKVTSASGKEGGAKIGTNVVDIFKIQNGKLVEKWDALEALDRIELFE
ncbi:MAG: nuclear transport factor 2 family protein [Steroidobacteraceae bacterium]